MTETLRLDGCAPAPLAGYLKALGVLRLVASPAASVRSVAADAQARGFWRDERFHLVTRLGREGLERFLLEEWVPTPLIGAWNGRAGFLEGEDEDRGAASTRRGAELMRALEGARAPRFAAFARVVAGLRSDERLRRYDALRAEAKALGAPSESALKERLKAVRKAAAEAKADLLPGLRAGADEAHLPLIDAAAVIGDEAAFAPLLGSGFNDGSRDFGVNFAEALLALFGTGDGAPSARARRELPAALFGETGALVERGAMGMFGPGQEGPNAGVGFSGSNPLNLWDMALPLEGALFWSGAATRRLERHGRGMAAFPFTFEPTSAAAGGLAEDDPNRPAGEVWAPLWGKPATAEEVGALFAEGRLTVGARAARTGLDAARAVAGLGAARGVAAFERFAMIVPDAKMPRQATPLGRIAAPRSAAVDLAADLEVGDWLGKLRRVAREKTAPARARTAVRRLEDALFGLTDPGRAADGARAALMALGDIAGWMAASPKAREALRPPPMLSHGWAAAADDGSAEFAMAEALAGIGWPGGGQDAHYDAGSDDKGCAGDRETEAADGADAAPSRSAAEGGGRPLRRPAPMAAHLAPVDEASLMRRSRRWLDRERTSPTVVWGDGALSDLLAAVLERRLAEAGARGHGGKPFGGARGVRASAVAAFLSGRGFNDARCARLLAGLAWAWPRSGAGGDGGVPLPFAFSAIAPLFAADEALCKAAGIERPPPVPAGLIVLLRRGDVAGAVAAAQARMRASGRASPYAGARGSGADGPRLVAALLAPLTTGALKMTLTRAYPLDDEED